LNKYKKGRGTRSVSLFSGGLQEDKKSRDSPEEGKKERSQPTGGTERGDSDESAISSCQNLRVRQKEDGIPEAQYRCTRGGLAPEDEKAINKSKSDVNKSPDKVGAGGTCRSGELDAQEKWAMGLEVE